jgi:hypothetical protein
VIGFWRYHVVPGQLTDHGRWRRVLRSETFGGVERRMPGRSAGEPMNSMPADSKTDWTPSKVDERVSGTPLMNSSRWIVLRLTLHFRANSAADQLRAARAERI